MKTLEEITGAMSEEDAAVVMQAIEEAKAETEEPAEEQKADGADADSKEEEEEEEAQKRLNKRLGFIKKENDGLKARIAKMEEDRERESFIKRAEVFPNVPTFSTEELGDFLLQINKKLDAATAERAEEFISAVNKICGDSSLLKEYGTSGTGSSSNGSAMSQAEAMAKVLMDKENITKAIALNKVWESNPELRNRYRMERRGN